MTIPIPIAFGWNNGHKLQITETSDYGESENDDVPIWEQRQKAFSFSFGFPIAQYVGCPDPIDSGFVLISDLLSALGVYTDDSEDYLYESEDDEERIFDGDFEILWPLKLYTDFVAIDITDFVND